MAIVSNLSNNLLNHIVFGTDGFNANNTGNYLGLLTALPTKPNSTSGMQEVPTSITGTCYKNGTAVEANDAATRKTGYARLKLSNNGASTTGLSGNGYFEHQAQWDNSNNYCIVTNDGDDIQMHNIYEEGVLPRQDAAGETPFSWTVVGFGLFTKAAEGTTGDTLLAYGDLVDENGYKTTVTLSEGSVPIFYKNGLQLVIADEPATVSGGY